MEKYITYLKKLISEKSSDIFSNGGIEHASILMSFMFSNTQKKIRMYSTKLNPKLTSTQPYLDALKKVAGNIVGTIDPNDPKYPRNPIEFKLLVDQMPDGADNEACNILTEKGVKIVEIKDNARQMICNRLSLNPCNFSVFDDDKFRIEIDPVDYKAIGSFNDRDVAETLIELFDEAYRISEQNS